MKILSLHVSGDHDANITYFDDGKVSYINLERIMGIKKYYPYTHDLPKVDEHLKAMNIPLKVDIIVVDYDAYTNYELFAEIPEQRYLEDFGMLAYRADKYYKIEHHYAHYMGAEWLYGDTGNGLVIDGCGDEGVHISVFKDRNRVKKLTFLDMCSIGDLYKTTALQLLGSGNLEHFKNNGDLDLSGNFMGLISYGNFNEKYADYLRQFDLEEMVTNAFNMSAYPVHGEVDIIGAPIVWASEESYHTVMQWHIDYFKTVQNVLAEKIIEFAKRYFESDDKFVYTGGVAHNVVINEHLNNAFPNMLIPPSIGDDGLSLGATYQILKQLDIKSIDCPTTQWQSQNIPIMSNDTVNKVADILDANMIVAVCQGESHIGPRALGNRSILYLPNRKYAAHHFNEIGIKHREWWRPYGVMILEEDLQEHLKTTTLSPYMLHVAEPTDLGKVSMSGVIHTDNTVRYQTINSGPYEKLLKRLKYMGHPPILINTSLNEQGKPMAHTIGDVKKFIACNKIEDEQLPCVIGNDVHAPSIEEYRSPALTPTLKYGHYWWSPYDRIPADVCKKLIDYAQGKFDKVTILDLDDSATQNEQIEDYGIRKGQSFFDDQEWVYDLLWPYLDMANKGAKWEFDIVGAEPYQISKYEVGDFYGLHNDGMATKGTCYNWPKSKILHQKTRKISMSLMLNDDYEGGELEIMDTPPQPKWGVGQMVFFPSYQYHEVKPVTKGTRYSLVLWFLGPPLR